MDEASERHVHGFRHPDTVLGTRVCQNAHACAHLTTLSLVPRPQLSRTFSLFVYLGNDSTLTSPHLSAQPSYHPLRCEQHLEVFVFRREYSSLASF
jgi:hypothetical protein